MCGIFGFLGEISKDLATRCTDTLAHRGPDGSGLWQGEGITLGHRRLSIVDLSSAGRQPMSFGDGRYWITYNGEIYNFVEIRTELEKNGHVFRSESDTEVLLAAFVEWGEACQLRFNGMWAFAIWDARERTLFLSRDRFGKKPLFYAFVRGDFVFASEMKAICPLLDEVRASEDFPWMKDNLFLYEATDKCLVEGIKRFPAGHFGIYRDGRLNLTRYWNTLDHLVEVPERYEDQVERFRELFIDACRIRMRSDVPIGTALSGGLDSSATICTMAHIAKGQAGARISSNWQHAFVAAFPGTPLDESLYARKVADHIGIRATVLDIDPLKNLDRLDDYFYKFEELYLTSLIPMVQTYGAIKENGISVTLDGHGADELMAGYGASLFEAFLDCGLDIKSIADVADAYRELFPKNSEQFDPVKGNLYLFLSFMVRRSAALLAGRAPAQSKDRDHLDFSRLDHFTRHLYPMTHETTLPTLLRNYDRYSMSSGVEIRMPFMDWRLVTFLMSLPWNSKVRDGYTKKIARDAVQPFMPAEIAYRKSKIGFNSPIVDWMKNELKEYFLDTVHSRAFAESVLVDASKVRSRVESVIYGENAKFTEGERAWSDLVPYLWGNSFLKRRHSWN